MSRAPHLFTRASKNKKTSIASTSKAPSRLEPETKPFFTQTFSASDFLPQNIPLTGPSGPSGKDAVAYIQFNYHPKPPLPLTTPTPTPTPPKAIIADVPCPPDTWLKHIKSLKPNLPLWPTPELLLENYIDDASRAPFNMGATNLLLVLVHASIMSKAAVRPGQYEMDWERLRQGALEVLFGMVGGPTRYLCRLRDFGWLGRTYFRDVRWSEGEAWVCITVGEVVWLTPEEGEVRRGRAGWRLDGEVVLWYK